MSVRPQLSFARSLAAAFAWIACASAAAEPRPGPRIGFRSGTPGGAVLGQDLAGDPGQDPGERLDAPVLELPEPGPRARPWSELLARDASVEFTARSAAVALETLVTETDPERRAAALFTLGAAGHHASRGVLAGEASEGAGPQRSAAILGLGELRGDLGEEDLLLVGLLDDADGEVASCALLALLRSGDPAWRELAEGFAAGGHRLAATAADGLALLDGAANAREFPAGRTLLELRWESAKAFGTIDGRSWSTTLLDSLAANRRFVDEVVLLSAADVGLPGVKDHLLELLLAGSGDACIRAAVRAMPREVDRLVQAGLWSPADERQWRVLLDEALLAGVESRMPAAVEASMRVAALAPTGAAVLLRREPRFEEFLLRPFESPETALRLRAARATGWTGEERFLEPLRGLEADADDRIRAAAWIARLGLGEPAAADHVRGQLLGGGTDRERAFLIDELAAAPRTPRLTSFLREIAGRVDGLERADLEAILALSGRSADGALLREGFLLAPRGSKSARRIVRALGRFPAAEDVEFLGGVFPVEGDFELNVELALALVRNGHPEVEPVLQAAVWSGPWNRSILAAAVVKERSGLRALEHWVVRPPAEATSEDIRRLGFAIGEWGGLDAVEALRARMGGVAGADRPALQGALLGALSARTH